MISYYKRIEECDMVLQGLLKSLPISLWDARTKGNIAKEAGIYRIFETYSPDQTLYIGKSRNLRKRLCGDLLGGTHTLREKLAVYFNLNDKASITDYLERHCECQVVGVPAITELSVIEHYAIAALRPSLNDEANIEQDGE